MDHLPVPKVKIDLDLSIPLLVTSPISYEKGAFETFPASRGLETDADGFVSFAELTARPVRESLEIMQSWLYFTLLARIFRHRFKMSDFVSSRLDDKDQMIITSKPLTALLRRGSDLPFSFNPLVIMELRIWHLARKQCDICDQPWPEAGLLGSKIILSIRVLLESLLSLDRLYYSQWRRTITSETPVPSLQIFFQQQLIREQWCSRQLERIQHGGSYSSTIYLCQLMRQPKRPGWPAKCEIVSRCSCFHFDRKAFTYPHVFETCKCKSIQSCAGDMLEILQAGGITLVKVTAEHVRGDLKVVSAEYVRATPTLPFVAISHVWADGLGHPEAGTILECQLQKVLNGIGCVQKHLLELSLRDAMKGLLLRGRTSTTNTFHFWVDFICIPQEQLDRGESTLLSLSWQTQPTLESQGVSDQKSNQDTAMSLMPAAYSLADYVLVLDDELNLVTPDSTSLEIRARLAACAWNSRYWTFQENCLGRRAYLTYQDTCMPFRKREYPSRLKGWAIKFCRHFSKSLSGELGHIEEQQEQPDPRLNKRSTQDASDYTSYGMLHGDFGRLIGRVPTSVGENLDAWLFHGPDRFVAIWRKLSQRDSTRPEDALRILATLLDLDPREFDTLDPAAQMRAILRSQEELPFGLLTAPLSRNDRAGDPKEERWVPSSLSHSLKLSDPALRVEEDGLVMDKPRVPFWTRLLEGAWNLNRWFLPGFDLLLVERPKLHNGTISLMWNESTHIEVVAHRGFERLSTQDTMVLILEMPDNYYHDIDLGPLDGVGACFMLERYEGKDMHVSFESSLSWKLIKKGTPTTEVRWSTFRSIRSNSLESCRVVIDCRTFSALGVIHPLTETHDLAMHSWPKLERRYDVLYRSLMSRHRAAFRVLLWATMPAGWGTLPMTVFFITGHYRFAGFILLAAALGIPTAMLIARNSPLSQTAIAYVAMHSLAPSEMDDSTWPFWKRLDAALPPMREWSSGNNLKVLVILRLYILTAMVFHAFRQFVLCRWF